MDHSLGLMFAWLARQVPNCNILYDGYFAQEQVKLKFYLFCVLLKWCVWSAEVEIGAIFQT